MKKDDYLKAKKIYEEIDKLDDDINHINYVFANSDVSAHWCEIHHNSGIRITNDELRFILENRKAKKEQLEKEIENI